MSKAATSIEKLDPRTHIIVKGARVHNLKNLDVAIPRDRFVVITGLSGSGKSSLAFDTLYAEGQRRYVESLSAYARQFLGKIEKPDVDYIKGISPAIAIEQKVNTRNSRSTVGTTTEIYDYLKLLFARIGKTISPISGNEVKRDTPDMVTNAILQLADGTRAMLLSPLHVKQDRSLEQHLTVLLQQGFTRVVQHGEVLRIDELLKESPSDALELELLIDRFAVSSEDEDMRSRIADSVETAFYEGQGTCFVDVVADGNTTRHTYSNRFELDGMEFEEPSVHFFSVNNPVGACRVCEGFGSVIGIDMNLVVPDTSRSVYDNAIVCWKGEKMSRWKERLINSADKFDFPIHRPFYELTDEQVQLLWDGNKYFRGLTEFFEHLEEQAYKIQYRVMLSRYRGKTVCHDCRGTRLRKDANYVKVGGKSVTDVVLMPVSKALAHFEALELNAHDAEIADRLLTEITNRLQYLEDVGLGYLSLNRPSNTLSGGESQRINLATSLGSSLVGSMYILDEPSIGLHSRDTQRLIKVLRGLQQLGNTLVVVEHDEEIMQAADQLIDLGPEAGTNGGSLVFQGDHKALVTAGESLTAKYLTGREEIEVPASRRKWKDKVTVLGATENNLKNIDVTFPLRAMTVVTGVSGSGKSTLVNRILYPALRKEVAGFSEQQGKYRELQGDLQSIAAVEFIDQNPIGKSSRSNPVTYVKGWDEIRALYSKQQLSKLRGYTPAYFSFNVDGGRCEVCKGEGEITVEMQFMADIKLVCEACKGRRFRDELLEVEYLGKNVHDLLTMTVDDAVAFFGTGKAGTHEKKILARLESLQEVGLGYVQLGQSSSTLSGGEAQRIKLASFLGMGSSRTKAEHTLFIFDEPTTGLHFHDIKKLLAAFNALLRQGHSLIVIEHNLDVVKCADWVIDLGPEGGEAGGNLVFAGTPEELVKVEKSYTGQYLRDKVE